MRLFLSFFFGLESDISSVDRREDCHNLEIQESMDVDPQVAKGRGGGQRDWASGLLGRLAVYCTEHSQCG